MTAPGSVELYEVLPSLDVLLERLLGEDVEAVVYDGNLRLGRSVLNE